MELVKLNGTKPTDLFRLTFQSKVKNKKKSFGSAFYDENGNYIYLKEVIYNNPVVICNWSDGSKTTAKCQSGDEYSPEVGLTICVFKRIHGNQFFQDLINNWAPTTGEKKITLKDVFKKND